MTGRRRAAALDRAAEGGAQTLRGVTGEDNPRGHLARSTLTAVAHPARYSAAVVEAMAAWLRGRVLDPFAGPTGVARPCADRARSAS